eukprot:6704220-Pyramimonas_sp.AAC.1
MEHRCTEDLLAMCGRMSSRVTNQRTPLPACAPGTPRLCSATCKCEKCTHCVLCCCVSFNILLLSCRSHLTRRDADDDVDAVSYASSSSPSRAAKHLSYGALSSLGALCRVRFSDGHNVD